MRDWIADVEIDDWVRDIADASRHRDEVPAHVTVRPEEMPSAASLGGHVG